MFKNIFLFVNKCVRYASLGTMFILIIYYLFNPNILPSIIWQLFSLVALMLFSQIASDFICYQQEKCK